MPREAHLDEGAQKGNSYHLKLQSHYAKLLNMYDEGRRLQFKSVEAWLDRLETVSKSTSAIREQGGGK